MENKPFDFETVNKALNFAAQAHNGKLRKGKNIPYILHPVEAAAIAATLSDDADVIAAALLHDVIEDAGVSYDTLKLKFGERIAGFVQAESETKKDDGGQDRPWRERKQDTLNRLENASQEEMIITLADKLSNIRAIYYDYCTIHDELWQRFNVKDPAEHAWYYRSIANILIRHLSGPAMDEYAELVKKVFCSC